LTGNKSEDFQKAVETLQLLTQSIIEVLPIILNSVIETVKKILDAVLYVYPNKRVVYLAMHHPKERVRRKNMRRIMRWIERNSK
jgi:hypothetical protein